MDKRLYTKCYYYIYEVVGFLSQLQGYDQANYELIKVEKIEDQWLVVYKGIGELY